MAQPQAGRGHMRVRSMAQRLRQQGSGARTWHQVKPIGLPASREA
jgi:hypothetical protein